MITKEEIRAYRCPRYNELPGLALYMDQVLIVLRDALAFFAPDEAATSTMIHNYTKQKLISPPENKKYGRDHVALLIVIFIMKRELAISEVTSLISLMTKERGTGEAYDIFCGRLEEALQAAFCGKETEEHGDAPALSAALTALANKLLFQSLLEESEPEPNIKQTQKK